jgi:hypothetical protein
MYFRTVFEERVVRMRCEVEDASQERLVDKATTKTFEKWCQENRYPKVLLHKYIVSI